MATGDLPQGNAKMAWQQYGVTLNAAYTAATTTAPLWPQQVTRLWNFASASPAPPRRGHPRHIARVWLEREDELIPPPWTDCVAHRFFESETATFGVIVESEAIPWVVSPGDYAADHVSWEALDIAIRQYILDQVAQTLPHVTPQFDGGLLGNLSSGIKNK